MSNNGNKETPMAEWNYLEWAEKAAVENLRGRLATGDVLLAQASTLLNILLVGLGASLGFGARVFGPSASRVDWGAAFVSVWLCVVAVVLVHRCIVTRDTQPLFNEPANLYKPELNMTEAQIRAFELENLQKRINLTKDRNSAVASWLDRCRYAAAVTPVVFFLGALA